MSKSRGPTGGSALRWLAASMVLMCLAARAAIASDPNQSLSSNSSAARPPEAPAGQRRAPTGKRPRRPQPVEEPRARRAQGDPQALAQLQARLMLGYNNTPPLFVTGTRDLFVDVARMSPGTRLTTMKTVDSDGDPVRYSLRPALVRDASPHFSVEPRSGELRLAGRQFVYQPQSGASLNSSLGEAAKVPGDGDDDDAADADDQRPGAPLAELEAANRNLYLLNVVADDGTYNNTVELHIHVINSSSLAALQSLTGGLPVQLTPEGSQLAGDRMESIARSKTSEFYDELFRSASQQRPNSSAVVYPNFVNPSLVRAGSSQPAADEAEPPATGAARPTKTPQASPEQQDRLASVHEPPRTGSSRPVADLVPDKQQAAGETLGSYQPLVVSLVVVGSSVTIALVLLMFIVPISVKRLKRRLKHVELQHEHLAQHASSGSSIVCSSSSSGGSTIAGHRHLHQQNPSIMHFSLASDRSTVCRQSSLDSAVSVQCPAGGLYGGHLNRINNGSIANPVYLNQHQSTLFSMPIPQKAVPHAYLVQAHQRQPGQRPAGLSGQNELYYPLDDEEFYSTINTDSGVLDPTQAHQTCIISATAGLEPPSAISQGNQFGLVASGEPQSMAFERPSESPGSDSGSSTRSLARFLSLPARHSSHHSDPDQSQTPDESKPSEQVHFNTIARYDPSGAREQTTPRDDWELDRSRLKFGNLLGQGQFGLVFMCRLKLDAGLQIVAVKTLKTSMLNDERCRLELLEEIESMKLLCNHPNVVRMLHCCTKVSPLAAAGQKSALANQILLVMEYVELGKLQSYLEKSRINHQYATSSHATSDHLTSKDLVKFIYHIAQGMEYVSSKCVVHRDLAARNVLVSSQKTCKIGDFGMARRMQSPVDTYERHSRKTKIPVRWMAPEVLRENRFTTKSDVFSFGILMWEIVTLGSTPYGRLENEQIFEAVALSGERPDKPEYCRPELYHIMSRCWSKDPDERPTFSCLVRQLDELLMSANDYVELDQYPDHDYYNATPYELLK